MGLIDAKLSTLSHAETAYKNFKGEIISSTELNHIDFSGKNVAIIGIDQHIVSNLNHITEHAKQVYVFQIQPRLVLPKTSRLMHDLIPAPLLTIAKQPLNPRVKCVLALRFLEKEVPNIWLRKLLTANAVQPQKLFLKSDFYFQALQKPNCKLIIWPISNIFTATIQTINEEIYLINTLVHTI